MPRRPYTNRTISEGRFKRDNAVQSYRSERVDPHSDERRSSHRRHGQFKTELDRDFAAMRRVWQMLRYGAIRMIGEVGRQY